VHLGLAAAIVAAVFVQVYLIGAYIFDGGQGALDAHRSIGLTTHGMVSAAALVAWLPRADVVLSLVLLAVGTVQIALVDGLPVGRRVAPSRRAVRARRPSWPAAALRRVGSR